MQQGKRAYNTPKIEKINIEGTDLIVTSQGNVDLGYGRGRGGGCDSVPYHRTAAVFSSGKNSGC